MDEKYKMLMRRTNVLMLINDLCFVFTLYVQSSGLIEGEIGLLLDVHTAKLYQSLYVVL